MSNTAFSTVSTNRLSSQPATPCQIYVRSSNAADSTALDVYGIVSGSPATAGYSIAGGLENRQGDVFESITQAILSAACLGIVTGYAPGVSAVGDVRGDTNPADGTTLTLGTITYRFKNTMTAVGDVQIGATVTDTMISLNHAINGTGSSGVDYYSTWICLTYSGVIETNVITLTDRVPCLRAVAPDFEQSNTHFSLRVPIGGVDGAALFSIPSGQTIAANPLTFSTEDHTTETLPALMLGVSPAIPLQGDPAMLRLWSDQEIEYRIESSTDQANWVTTSEGTVTLVPSTLTYVHLAELHEYIRFVIVVNDNTDDTILDARVIY